MYVTFVIFFFAAPLLAPRPYALNWQHEVLPQMHWLGSKVLVQHVHWHDSSTFGPRPHRLASSFSCWPGTGFRLDLARVSIPPAAGGLRGRHIRTLALLLLLLICHTQARVLDPARLAGPKSEALDIEYHFAARRRAAAIVAGMLHPGSGNWIDREQSMDRSKHGCSKSRDEANQKKRKMIALGLWPPNPLLYTHLEWAPEESVAVAAWVVASVQPASVPQGWEAACLYKGSALGQCFQSRPA
jgi:hypothetical protein